MPEPVRLPWPDLAGLNALLAVLDDAGEEARVVGGAVRNTLLGEPVSDWDIATTALPTEVTRRARVAGWKVVPTGIAHGTVTVVVEGRPFEVTTLREDIETDGRHAVVRFGRDFKADALRRDFTINALSAGRDGIVHDYAGGLADLAARRVRFIGEPDRRIAEDVLRILRLFRFHARYGDGPVDFAAMGAAIRARGGLALLSRERVRVEILKLLASPRAAPVLAEMEEAGLLLLVLGGVSRTTIAARMAALEAEAGLEADPIRRLAALGLFVREDALRLAERLRLSNGEAHRLEALAMAGETLAAPPDRAAARAHQYRLGFDMSRDALLLAAARSGDRAWLAALRALATDPAPARSPFRGADAVRLGLPPGPRLGAVLAEAERLWIAEDFPAEPARQEALLRRALEI